MQRSPGPELQRLEPVLRDLGAPPERGLPSWQAGLGSWGLDVPSTQWPNVEGQRNSLYYFSDDSDRAIREPAKGAACTGLGASLG